MITASPGDLVQILDHEGRFFYFRLTPGARLETHRGIILHDDLIGRPYGSKVQTHLGRAFYLFTPSIHDLVNEAKRQSQILFPKDIGLILMTIAMPGMLQSVSTRPTPPSSIFAQACNPSSASTMSENPILRTMFTITLRRLGLSSATSTRVFRSRFMAA